ncbi:MAG TPA: hypothetical protein GX510_04945 [Firmicutes bacterium]|nr:hypothetical protein [Candidatus Fermentithermobacillaceae bacterium]
MKKPAVTAVVFEGGQAHSDIEEEIVQVRKEVCLDTLEKLTRVPEIDGVVLVTNHPDLIRRAGELGVLTRLTGQRKFHFGNELRDVIVEYGIDNVLYLSGGAVPLMTESEFLQIALELKRRKNVVVMNNVQSADLIAFSPARAIDEIPLPDRDNPLGTLLKDIGLRRVLVPNSGRVNFDVDTPTDVLILGLHPSCGKRAKKAIQNLSWNRENIMKAWDLLRDGCREIAVLGRVGPSVITYINSNMVHRMRVFSEERGMKALGREDQGMVVSLIGHVIEALGAEQFFRYLGSVADCAFFDTRVVFSHLKKRFSDRDRFNSDLMRWDMIEDPWLRDFTRASQEASIPIVLGGHSLVSAGLWVMAETVVAERRQPDYQRGTEIMPRVITS